MAHQPSVQGLEDPAWLRAIELATMSCLPMAIKVVIRLNILNILAKEDEGTHLSPSQIVARMDFPSKPSPPLIDRLLRVLASHDILSSSLQYNNTDNDNNHTNPLPTRAYGLNSISKYFVPHHSLNASLSPFLIMHQDLVFLKTLSFMEEAILDGGEPFVKAHGTSSFLYNKIDASFDQLFNLSMHDYSKLLISSLVDTYNGFDGLHSLVDVGGGLGITIGVITSKHPHIHGINFDLPHVIASAPSYPNVEHVGGDMFVSIPNADAIFMKWILHDWSDEHCVMLLKKCYEALPSKGKVIVVDAVLPIEVDHGLKTRVNSQLDLLMFAYNTGGRERTLEEFKDLANAGGFSHMQVVCEIQQSSVLEIYKG